MELRNRRVPLGVVQLRQRGAAADAAARKTQPELEKIRLELDATRRKLQERDAELEACRAAGRSAELELEATRRALLAFQLATGLDAAPQNVQRRDDSIAEGATARTARVMRTVPLAMSTPPPDQETWPAHLPIDLWAPHLERLARQLLVRDQVHDIQQLVQRVARGVRRSLALRAVTHGADFESAPWLKSLKPIELPASLADMFKWLIMACGFCKSRLSTAASAVYVTCDMVHVKVRAPRAVASDVRALAHVQRVQARSSPTRARARRARARARRE